MKFAVVIPTRNEARTIAGVVAAADAGLASLGRPALIVNADGGSDDGSGAAFLATSTRAPKRLLSIGGPPGKGRNLLAAWTFCLDQGVDAVVMLDGDMLSVQPWWIERFLRPIAAGRAQFVSPLYRRNLYRAVTARNVSRAFLYGWFGVDVQHPLSGNSAIARPLLRRLAERAWTPTQLRYGVETAIVSTVLAERRAWATAELDRCEDKANSGRRKHILSDVAVATIEAARAFDPRPGPAGVPVAAPMTFADGPSPDTAFLDDAIEEGRQRRSHHWPDYVRWAGDRISKIESAFRDGRIDASTWFHVFARAILETRELSKGRAAEEYAAALVPLIAIRALTVWREIASMPTDAIDAASSAEIGLMRAAVSAALGWSATGEPGYLRKRAAAC